MKINRFIALAAISLLVIGAMGVIGYKVFAQSSTPATQTQECSQQDDDRAEVKGAPDTDNVDLQCVDQDSHDGQTSEGSEGQETEKSDGQETAPQGSPSITVEQAQKAALAVHSGTVIKTELDNENGNLIYSVEFTGGSEVKVDAMTGVVLGTESGED
jgi:uncharacterized membrane protein YkoI